MLEMRKKATCLRENHIKLNMHFKQIQQMGKYSFIYQWQQNNLYPGQR